MPSRCHRCSALWLTAVLGASVVHGADTLIGDAAATRFPGGRVAYGGSATWQHTEDWGGVLTGLSGTDYPFGSLTTLDLDAYRFALTHVVLSAGASYGEATASGHTSSLVKGRVALEADPTAAWSLRLADQYVDFDEIRGHLLVGSVEYRPVPAWGIKAGGGHAISGTATDRYGELALNWYGVTHLFGGVVGGRTGYELTAVGATREPRLFQVYAGAGIPLPRGRLNVAVDALDLEGERRQTLRIGVVEPIRP